VFGRRFRGQPPLVVAAGQLSGSALLILPLALLVDRSWTLPLPSGGIWAAVIGLAVFSTALAYVIFFRILARAGATNLLLVTFLIPVSALLIGIAFLGETLNPHHLAGMALIGFGLAAIDGRPLRILRRGFA
jgi:drug/metabolite transporter (DMT)-like permease